MKFILWHSTDFREKNKVFLTIFLRSFAFFYLLSFMTPLIYESNLYKGQSFALMITLAVVLIYALIAFLAVPFLFLTYKYFGLRGGLVFGVLTSIVLFVLLEFKQFLLLAVVYSVESLFWWSSYYALFIAVEGRRHLGQLIGKDMFLRTVGISFSPLLAGLILNNIPDLYYLIGIILLLLVLFMVFSFKPHRVSNDIQINDLVLTFHSNKKDFFIYLIFGFENGLFIFIWPLLLYTSLKNFSSVGFLLFIVSLFSGFIVYLLGKYLDKYKHLSAKLESLGLLAFAVSWLGKFFWLEPIAFGIFDIVRRFFDGFVNLPLLRLAFSKAYSKDINQTVVYVVFRELALNSGIIVMCIVGLIFVYLGISLWWLLALAGLLILLSNNFIQNFFITQG
ncbi:MAG: hypothetical protein KatS3mg090_0625 [Patescibacteria group bacterium]|nr:MAG: hypothetical protein KatS3mg090_0625 [Patescibacteria group bacterium]